MELLIQNGLVLDPVNGIEQVMDVLLEDGKIKAVGASLATDGEVVDASGKTVMPGFVDMHVHLRDPGFTHKEDILTGCEAAAAGGVTSLLCMPNTMPAIDTPETVRYITDKAKQAKARVYVTGAITKGLSGGEMNDFAALKKAGVLALSDDGRPVENAAMMAEALRQADGLGLVVTSHCEDLSIINGGIVNDGRVSRELGVKGMHRSAEDTITAREIILAETNGCAVHIAHVSTRLSVQLIREAKARGAKVTAETCPHYFSMTEDAVLSRDAGYRMSPPLREQADMEAVLAGVCDGTIDCIVTDHAPHTAEEKADFHTAPNGVIGMETSFSASYTHLVKTGRMTLAELVRKMSLNPARVLGISAGTLSVGADADLVIADLGREWLVEPEKSHSKAGNMIYKGQTLTGRVIRTILGGRTVYQIS